MKEPRGHARGQKIGNRPGSNLPALHAARRRYGAWGCDKQIEPYSIWTRDLATAHRAAARLEAGYVWINNASQHFIGAPFGGVKQSGIGREECFEELLEFTQVKNVNVKLSMA